jgi:hypothetical protein
MLGAVGATIHHPAGFMAMPNDSASAVAALWGESVDRAFETIKIMRDSVGNDLNRLIILITTYLASLNSSVQFILRIRFHLRLQNPRCAFHVVSINHTLQLRRFRRGHL